MAEETFDEAISCLGRRIGGGYGVKHGFGRKFHYLINQLIEEEVTFDLREEQISTQTVGAEIKKMVIDSGDEGRSYEDFQSEVRDYSTEVILSDTTEYEIVFPLNLQDFQPIPTEFDANGIEITRISIEEWEEYITLAKEDKELIQDYFRKPHIPESTDKFTYWTCTIDAKDEIFATYELGEAIQILLGKILYAFKKRYLYSERRADDLPRQRWTPAAEPHIYLCFDAGSFEYCLLDYDYQEPELIPWAKDEYFDRFNNIPSLQSGEDIDQILRTAFRLYFYGMTTKQKQQSYFTFSRGIEVLSQKDNQKPFSEAMDRALFAHSLVGGEGMTPWFEDALDDFDSKRNALAHEGPHTPLQRHHQNLAKILLDDLIALYLACYDDFTADDVGDMLKYGNRAVNRAKLLSQFQDIDSPHLE